MVSREKIEGLGPEASEFQRFRDMLQNICGINLGQNKEYLVNNRIRRILLAQGFDSLSQLIVEVEKGRRQLRQQVIDAMTTNETFWFRDTYPFDNLTNNLLPLLQSQNPRGPIRIWSAACSSGQEPYSISIAVEEYFRANALRRVPVEIVATDVSSSALQRAELGVYDRLSMARGLSTERRDRFFQPIGDDNWRVADIIRNRVQFRPLNLQESYFLLGRFDIIFCRNVLIYFSAQLKREILHKLNRALAPGGYVFLGSSESLGGAGDLFEVVHCNPGVVYKAK